MKIVKASIAAICMIVLLLYILNPLMVKQNSMQNMYHPKDIVFVNRFYKSIERGDIIVFRQGKQKHIKRCVALPGDTVLIRNGKLFVNGTLLHWQTEKKITTKKSIEKKGFNNYYFNNWSSLDFGPFVVPKRGLEYKEESYYRNLYLGDSNSGNSESFNEDYYFFMGDNRENSIDSRAYGPISSKDIVGKVYFKL